MDNKVIANVYGVESPNNFQFINGNRTVDNLKHIANIKEAMKRGDFIPPIIIDQSTRFIIDGQHRFMAACELWRENRAYTLSYLEFKFENPLLAAIRYNSKSKKWTTADYVRAYITDKRQSYDILQKFCQTHEFFKGGRNGLQYKAAAQLLTGQTCTDSIQKGILQITEEQTVIADIAYNQLSQMANTIGRERGGYTLLKRDIVLAWLEVRDLILSNITMDTYIKTMKKNFICPISDRKVLYQNMYLEIYNKSKRKK